MERVNISLSMDLRDNMPIVVGTDPYRQASECAIMIEMIFEFTFFISD